jgi:uncharacterized protein
MAAHHRSQLIANAAPRSSPLRFFVLVFALSVPFWVAGAIADRFGFEPELPMNLQVSSLMVICPLVAAAILIFRVEGFDGIMRLLMRALDYRSMTNRRWYAAIVFLNAAILLGAYGITVTLGWPPPRLHVPQLALPLLLLIFLVSAVCEETGWTGYATDPLQDRWSQLTAGLIIGSLWAVWHVVPLVQASYSPAWIAWKSLETLSARFLIVWIYNSTGKSVFAAVVFHAVSNVGFSLFIDLSSRYYIAVVAVLTAITAAIVTIPSRAHPAPANE